MGRRLVKAAREAGGILAEEDLATFEGRVEAPVHVAYRGYEVYKPGFWTQGPVMLQTLNLLSGFDLKAMGLGSADTLHTFTEAMKLAFDDRDVFYGDPDFSKIPGEALLALDYASERRKLIDPKRASVETSAGSSGRRRRRPIGRLRACPAERPPRDTRETRPR